MSIAWGSLVLLILLLPGILFFVGALFPEQFTRDAEQRSPLGQLAGTLVIAFGVHGVLYALLTGACAEWPWLPCISVRSLLLALNATAEAPGAIEATDRMFATYRWHIFAYTVATCAAGLGLGALYGTLVTRQRVSALTRHPWIYDIGADGLTYAYVMTHVRQDERILMYRGFLKAAGLRADGRFSYLILRDAARYYMKLDPDSPLTSETEKQRRIGATRVEGDDPSRPNHDPVASTQFLFIEGEDIANAVFEKLAVKKSKESANFDEIVKQERAKLLLQTEKDAASARDVVHGEVPPQSPPEHA